ncbi:TetR family transcriptional regulator [Leclercia adecarboxylata]|jgi:AcrR family transcriptional regulator|uniref:TetR family transcriptional regulator n=1 Tax=Leclercia TaxID=83654 RepID=UPI001304D242|nr:MULTISPECIES: TetR family transcriptional regulator [Leclercia]MDQ2128438.1 TetR family transcriptional regulator [Leclercia adecarboxylata]MDV7057051.1 TetR family transcriptional regulator [Leclercia adecarboxylata]
MSYLAREERRTQIVDAAVALTISDGLAAATVRAVAAAINASPGQIHHHFPSADALRAEAFREFGLRLEKEYDDISSSLTPFDQLFLLLDCDSYDSGPGVERLWKEAIFASGQNSLIRESVQAVLEGWRVRVADALLAVVAERGLVVAGDLHVSSRRLIGIAIGWDVLTDFNFQRPDRNTDLSSYIEFELSGLIG